MKNHIERPTDDGRYLVTNIPIGHNQTCMITNMLCENNLKRYNDMFAKFGHSFRLYCYGFSQASEIFTPVRPLSTSIDMHGAAELIVIKQC